MSPPFKYETPRGPSTKKVRKMKSDEIEKEAHRRAESVWTFRKVTSWSKMPPHLPGVSWLELFIRYTQVGGYVQAKEELEGKFTSRILAKSAFENFRRDFKRVVSTRVSTADTTYFLPSTIPKRCLTTLGISSHVSSIAGTPCWPQHVAEKVAAVVVSLVTTLTVVKRKALAEGTLQTEEKPLRLKGAIPWVISDPPSDALPKPRGGLSKQSDGEMAARQW